MYSPEYVPPLTATTMYCCPLSMYVIGEPLCGAGMYTAPTSLPRRFVVGAKHGAAPARRNGGGKRVAGYHERLRDERADVARLAGARYRECP